MNTIAASVKRTMLPIAAFILLSSPLLQVMASEPSSAGAVCSAMPRMEWALSERLSGLYAFTFGEGIHEFRFDPVNAANMQYLEFDVFLPDKKMVDLWKTGDTEFEITSSGTSDLSEYAWSGYDLWKEAAVNGLQLTSGWNHVRLNLPENCAADLSRINYIRWYWSESGPDRQMPGCEVANLRFSADGAADPPNASLQPFIPSTLFETEDVPVALADVTGAPYYADPTGALDSTRAIQDALDDVNLQGGGTVWMPAGTYRITGQIRIPSYVTLRGDFPDPETRAGYGTLIALDIPEEDRDDTGTFMLGGCGGVCGLTVYYPDQSPEKVRKYPFAFYTDGRTGDSYLMPSVINCTVLNGYRGIGATTAAYDDPDETGHENMYVMNFRGTFLSCGIEAYNESDFSFFDDVKIGNRYWADASRAGILPPVNERRLTNYTRKHAAGLILGDLEWVSLNNITVEDCLTGIHTVRGKRPEVDFQGLLHGITTENCRHGLVVDALYIDNGMVLANSRIDKDLCNNTDTVVRLFNVDVNGVRTGRLREDSDESLDLPVPDPDAVCAKPAARLYTAWLDGSGRTDVSAKLQALLDEAGTMGGIVFLPGGVYRLDKPVTVPAGVELRGTSDVPTRDMAYGLAYKGTTLLSYYKGGGPDKTALITLSGQGAGIRGVRINYPENRVQKRTFDPALFDTSYAVKGTAPDVYIVNSYIVSSAYGVDFTGCDHHYISGLAAYCYKTTLRLGGEGGILRNSFQNPGMVFISNTPYVVLTQYTPDLCEYISRHYSDYLVLDNASGEMVYNIATLAARNTLTNKDSENTLVINLSSDTHAGMQTVMDGGSLTLVNAMRWDGECFLHEKGLLKIYNRFEHGYSSGLHGDALEETYIACR